MTAPPKPCQAETTDVCGTHSRVSTYRRVAPTRCAADRVGRGAAEESCRGCPGPAARRASGGETGEAAFDEDRHDLADVFEVAADGLALDVAVVDAFQDDGEFEERQAGVPVEPGDVAAGAFRVAGDELVGGGEAGGPVHVAGPGGGEDLVAEVDEHEPEVGERVAEGGHLPVQDGGDPVVGVDEHVVQPVVAVHDGGCPRLRHGVGEAGTQLVDAGQVAAAGGVELFAPAADLAFEETVRAAEVGESDGRGVHRVQGGEGVDQPQRDVAGAVRTSAGELVCPA